MVHWELLFEVPVAIMNEFSEYHKNYTRICTYKDSRIKIFPLKKVNGPLGIVISGAGCYCARGRCTLCSCTGKYSEGFSCLTRA